MKLSCSACLRKNSLSRPSSPTHATSLPGSLHQCMYGHATLECCQRDLPGAVHGQKQRLDLKAPAPLSPWTHPAWMDAQSPLHMSRPRTEWSLWPAASDSGTKRDISQGTDAPASVKAKDSSSLGNKPLVEPTPDNLRSEFIRIQSKTHFDVGGAHAAN